MHYLTGFQFMRSDRLLLLIIPAEDEPVAILPNFEESNWTGNVGIRADLLLWDDTEGPAAFMRQACTKLPAIATLAIESLGMRVMEHDLLREHFTNAQLVSAEHLVQAMRLRKDPGEVDALRRRLLSLLRSGSMSESKPPLPSAGRSSVVVGTRNAVA